ncbi:hypothetical protein RRF57_010287 [Xylaria bambusicola]|uniref:Uncharacterized protein n=1 Tax=Xylaria bambusicola TaxID=326684 RepID=A0AAN7V194_9PEZI
MEAYIHNIPCMQPYPLCVHLTNVRQPLGQDIARHFVAIFVAEFGRLTLGTLGECTGVRDRAGHDAADRR